MLSLTFGKILFYGGAMLLGGSLLALVIGNAHMSKKSRKIKKKLYDRYGF